MTSSTNIQGNFLTTAEIQGPAVRGQAMVTAMNDNAVEFDLTTESLLQLTGSIGLEGTANQVGFYAVTTNILLTLSGQNFNFQESLPDSVLNNPFGSCCIIPFDVQFILDPGMYTIAAMDDNGFSASLVLGGALLDSGVSVNADFTPIPEPRWSGLVCVLALAGCVPFRRTRAGPRPARR